MRRATRKYLFLLVLLTVWGLSGCTMPAAPSSDSGGEVNVVEAANLRMTEQVDIARFKDDNTGAYEDVATITDPAQIEEIVNVLDRPVSLGPVPACVHKYKLNFRLSDQTVQEFGYICEDGSAFLVGGPPLEEGYAMSSTSDLDMLIERLTQ